MERKVLRFELKIYVLSENAQKSDIFTVKKIQKKLYRKNVKYKKEYDEFNGQLVVLNDTREPFYISFNRDNNFHRIDPDEYGTPSLVDKVFNLWKDNYTIEIGILKK